MHLHNCAAFTDILSNLTTDFFTAKEKSFIKDAEYGGCHGPNQKNT